MRKAIRTWAIAGYYRDVRDVSSIILIAEITVASTRVPPSRPHFDLHDFELKCDILSSKCENVSSFYFLQNAQYLYNIFYLKLAQQLTLS